MNLWSRLSTLFWQRKRKPTQGSPWLLATEDFRRLQALRSHPELAGVFPQLLERQAALELSSVVGAKDKDAAWVALARLNLMMTLLDLPQRVASFNQEHLDDVAKRDAAVHAEPLASSFHLGSPNFWRPDGALDADGARRSR